MKNYGPSQLPNYKKHSCEAEGMHSDITFYSKIKTSSGACHC